MTRSAEMSKDYIKQLEDANEQLQQKLVKSENKVAEYESTNAYYKLRNILKNDDEQAWGWYCNIAMPIHDQSTLSIRDSRQLAVVLMRRLFNIDMTIHINYIRQSMDEKA